MSSSAIVPTPHGRRPVVSGDLNAYAAAIAAAEAAYAAYTDAVAAAEAAYADYAVANAAAVTAADAYAVAYKEARRER